MKTAFLFPGQGSQAVGMLGDLAQDFPHIKDTFTQASDILGYDAWQLVTTDPQQKLNQTQYTQPMLCAASIALWRVYCDQKDEQPDFCAGHSLGEYSALVAANALDFADALQLVEKRGQLMQQAVPSGQGAMAAIIGLSDDQVASLCDEVRQQQILSPANFNTIGQVVVAGHTEAVERAINAAKSMGAKLAKRLEVSVPSHCALMQPAADAFQTLIEAVNIQKPSIAVIHNVDAKPHSEPAAIKQALIQQLSAPVQWVKTANTLIEQGVTQMYECGPGKVLINCVKRIDKSLTLASLSDKSYWQTSEV